MSGLICARTLADHGLSVSVFDKSKRPGGRMSTRRESGLSFDHGAQYFTARSESFARFVESWVRDEVVAEWQGRLVHLRDGTATPDRDDKRRFIGVPGMNAVALHLASAGDVTYGFQVASLVREQARWTLIGVDGRRAGDFDVVLLAMPAPQTRVLAETSVPSVAERAATATYAPCWAVMLAFEESLPVDFDAGFVAQSPLAWVARDSAKTGRVPGSECWVLHACPNWSEEQLDDEPEAINRRLLPAFAGAVGIELPAPRHARAHLWRYAQPTSTAEGSAFFDDTTGIGACGDWFVAPKVEGAFASGVALAAEVMTWANGRPERSKACSSERTMPSANALVQRRISFAFQKRNRL